MSYSEFLRQAVSHHLVSEECGYQEKVHFVASLGGYQQPSVILT